MTSPSSQAIIAAGWGSVKDQKDTSEGNEYEVLLGLYNSAKAAKLGIHTGTLAVIIIFD